MNPQTGNVSLCSCYEHAFWSGNKIYSLWVWWAFLGPQPPVMLNKSAQCFWLQFLHLLKEDNDAKIRRLLRIKLYKDCTELEEWLSYIKCSSNSSFPWYYCFLLTEVTKGGCLLEWPTSPPCLPWTFLPPFKTEHFTSRKHPQSWENWTFSWSRSVGSWVFKTLSFIYRVLSAVLTNFVIMPLGGNSSDLVVLWQSFHSDMWHVQPKFESHVYHLGQII